MPFPALAIVLDFWRRLRLIFKTKLTFNIV